MAFGNIATIYIPTAANAGSSLWGTDVRKLLNSADSGSDATTITNHGTGGVVVRTEDPYSTTTTDDVQANFGWAISSTDMNSISGAKRFYPAGNHSITVRMKHNGTTSATGTLLMYIYRVGDAAGGRVRTLLGNDSASVSLPALSGEVTATVTVALSEIVFAIDETIQYSFEFSITGVAVTGKLVTFYGGTQSSVVSQIDTPTLGVLADTVGSASGTVSVTANASKVLGTDGSSAGLVTVSGAMSSRADTVGSSSGSASVNGLISSVAGTIGTSSGSASVNGVLGAISSVDGSSSGSSTVDGVLGTIGSMAGSSSGLGSTNGQMSSRADMSGTSSGIGTATAQASSVAGSSGSANGSTTVDGQASKVLGSVGTVEIGSGAPTVIVNNTTIFAVLD